MLRANSIAKRMFKIMAAANYQVILYCDTGKTSTPEGSEALKFIALKFFDPGDLLLVSQSGMTPLVSAFSDSSDAAWGASSQEREEIRGGYGLVSSR